jgi:peptide/nickel transport system substrate-binding protein
VLQKPRDYKAVRQALAHAGYNGEQIVVVGPTDVQPIRALSLVGTDQLRRSGMNVDLQEMEQAASVRRQQNQAAPDKAAGTRIWGSTIDRSQTPTLMATP